MNLRLIQMMQDSEDLTIAEAKRLIEHLKFLIDAEDIPHRASVTGWRKRVIEGMSEEHIND